MKAFSSVPSKLLLFGEHSILLGFPAITLPLYDFTACLKFPGENVSEEARQSNGQLKQFYNYLTEHPSWFKANIDFEGLKQAIDNGLYLDSNIPQGYGLGSSASLCVAIYKAFGISNIEKSDMLILLYSRMESFFHGRSSGIDPLAIHSGKPVVITREGIHFLSAPVIDDNIFIYLLDSGIQRNSKHMIRDFALQLNDTAFRFDFNLRYMPILDKMKEVVLNGGKVTWELLKELSNLQLTFFKNLIPLPILSLWEQYSVDPNKSIKILGAGGGGYFLVFSKNNITAIDGFKILKLKLEFNSSI